MGMELLASPYLPGSKGGFYSDADAARALVEHLEERGILFWRTWPLWMHFSTGFTSIPRTHPSLPTATRSVEEGVRTFHAVA